MWLHPEVWLKKLVEMDEWLGMGGMQQNMSVSSSVK